MSNISIRWRVTFWNTLAFAIVVVGFSVIVYSLLRQTHYNQLDKQLVGRLDELLSDPELAVQPTQRLNFWFHKLGKHVEIKGVAFTKSGNPVASSEGLEASRSAGLEVQPGSKRFDSLEIGQGERNRRLVAIKQIGEEILEIQLPAELEHLDEELGLVAKSLMVTIAITLVVAALIAYLLAMKTLAPIETLTRMTDAITAENLSLRLPVPNPRDELGHLATTINSMIGRLQSSFEQVKRFTADAAHELRTPIAVIRSEAEIGVDQAVEPAARERFKSIIEESTRFAIITTQLLELSLHDATPDNATMELVNVSGLLQQSVSSLQSMAAERDQQLVIDALAEQAMTRGDEDQLLRVFHNLIENAIKYSRPGNTTRVLCEVVSGHVLAEIVDSGIGIPDDAISKVFDRFFLELLNLSETKN